MTKISVYREGLEESFVRVIDEVDRIDQALGRVPNAPDGGIATEFIGLTMAAALEAAGTTADSYRALVAISRDVLKDLEATDESAAQELRDLKQQVEND